MSQTAVLIYFLSWPVSIALSYWAVKCALRWLDKPASKNLDAPSQ